MASAKAIKKRRKATQNIHKITRTMELVATSRLRLAVQKLANVRPYREKIDRMSERLCAGRIMHPLMKKPSPSWTLLLGIASNRGLCGSYNSQLIHRILHLAKEMEKEGKNVQIYLSGRKAIHYFKFHGIKVEESYPLISDIPSLEEIAPIADHLADLFKNKGCGEVRLVYSKKSKVVEEIFLPISWKSLQDDSQLPWCLPSAEKVLEKIVPSFVRSRLWECFLEAAVSEQSARMVAMKTATENAEDMIKKLTRQYNRARQTQITQEILEILSGAQAGEKE